MGIVDEEEIPTPVPEKAKKSKSTAPSIKAAKKVPMKRNKTFIIDSGTPENAALVDNKSPTSKGKKSLKTEPAGK